MARQHQDLTGMKFGRLTAISRVVDSVPTTWLFLCECGTEKEINSSAVKSGSTQSCGCLNKERRIEISTTHGCSGHPLYKIWEGMVGRCTRPQSTEWNSYGGRGIKVCDQWLNSPSQFFKDMGDRPKGFTIERINNNGNYEPSNCKWASPLEQGANKRNNNTTELDGKLIHIAEASRLTGIPETSIRRAEKEGRSISKMKRVRNVKIEFNGESMTMIEWAEKIGIEYGTLKYRMRKGWSASDALTMPVKQ